MGRVYVMRHYLRETNTVSHASLQGTSKRLLQRRLVDLYKATIMMMLTDAVAV